MIDLQPLFDPILAAVGLAIAALIASYVPRALAVVEARTGIALTDQQRATVLGAVQTAAGIIETQIDRGAMRVEHVQIGNPDIAAQANAVIAAVPNAAAALGVTPDSVARMIVGTVDTASRSVVGAAPAVAAPVAAPALQPAQ